MDRINNIAARHGLWVVEDAAEAHLAKYRGRPVGGLSTIATFSFFGNKILTSGEGGGLTLSDSRLAERARTLRNQGVDRSRRYFFPVIGYNFRLSNLACALLCAQLERSDALVAARRRVFKEYESRLHGVEGIGLQPIADWAEPAPWLFSVTIDPLAFGISRDALVLALDASGIETRPFFTPLHELPPYRSSRHVPAGGLTVTDRLASTGINLPTYPTLTDGELDRIAEAIVSAQRSARKKAPNPSAQLLNE
jgi:perosamine synthetase